jgi:hypothetical protein
MRDLDVRRAVRLRLQTEHDGDADTRIVEEMGVWHGSVRVDVAVINGEIVGYELKSARDTLTRLPAQAELYSQVFDRMYLVAAQRHVDHALPFLPPWWGILAAVEDQDVVRLEEVRRAAPNPAVSPIQLARLLWRSEALAILERSGLARGVKSASREKVAERLSSAMDPVALAFEVRRALKDRAGWLGEPVGDQREVAIS